MRVELIRSPWKKRLHRLLKAVRRELILASPYITLEAVNYLHSALPKGNALKLRVLTNLDDGGAMINGSLEPEALVAVLKRFPESVITSVRNLHLKAYIADTAHAIVTSANLTEQGLTRNWECGVAFSEHSLVSGLRSYLVECESRGKPVSQEELEQLSKRVKESRERCKPVQREIEKAVNELQPPRPTEELRDTTVFREYIVELLKRHGPLSTPELYPKIQAKFPDRCSDPSPYAKWRHRMRAALEIRHLRQERIRRLRDGRYELIE